MSETDQSLWVKFCAPTRCRRGAPTTGPAWWPRCSFLYEPDIPCNDTRFIWTRYWESGTEDSYFVTLDGQPMPQAIFEGDCTNGGQGYDWAALNYRDQGDDDGEQGPELS